MGALLHQILVETCNPVDHDGSTAIFSPTDC